LSSTGISKASPREVPKEEEKTSAELASLQKQLELLKQQQQAAAAKRAEREKQQTDDEALVKAKDGQLKEKDHVLKEKENEIARLRAELEQSKTAGTPQVDKLNAELASLKQQLKSQARNPLIFFFFGITKELML